MKGKIILLTGFTSGIGKATAIQLAGTGATLGLVCRNLEKGEEVAHELVRSSGNSALHLFTADLSSQKEIRKVAEEIRSTFDHIDILINNAGAIQPKRILTVDCIETTFATNHLAYFLLTHLLLDLLKASPSGRIINLASEAQKMGTINFEDLNYQFGFTPIRAYSQSKLANIIFTYELSRHLAGTNITVNCMHPGVVRTNFGKTLDGFFIKLLFPLFRSFMRTPEKGAETLVWLATSDEAQRYTGMYFKNKKPIRSQSLSYDANITQRLWNISCRLTSINSF
jgi:retinol dehydrogenase 14